MNEHESWALYRDIDLAVHLFITIVGDNDTEL